MKLKRINLTPVTEQVALFTGAWVETANARQGRCGYHGRALHGRVG
ncbi:hypothetical protein PAMC26510_12840 [Caballeronia sordidicola]|uniref:Uncharacterized protein n=1 Tax=Caballeronia sordidicola TaxID=196367 RepID=A0A242MY12_CABSO|nr:hypothetical protein PAMC26510_12840 [Caballeronia sordidicola]